MVQYFKMNLHTYIFTPCVTNGCNSFDAVCVFIVLGIGLKIHSLGNCVKRFGISSLWWVTYQIFLLGDKDK